MNKGNRLPADSHRTVHEQPDFLHTGSPEKEHPSQFSLDGCCHGVPAPSGEHCAFRRAAGIHAGATRYAADTSAAASRYSADKNYAGTMYSADKHYQGTKYSADKSYEGTKYSSDNSVRNPSSAVGYVREIGKAASNIFSDLFGWDYDPQYLFDMYR